MSDTPETTRRHFLHVLAAGGALASTGAIAGCSKNGECGISGQIPAGNSKLLTVGSLTVVSGQPLCIGRDANGVYAMSLICSHACCDIGETGTVTDTELTCGCHDSTFDANGKVTGGPAETPLEHFPVTIDATGRMTVDTDVTVDPSTRTPPV
ncbi:MAG: Rieske (2Fe-2S) protein [Myxococcales bacterium]|nr:Rieske (2Fe-2S) protein [Myxococcales bacterium]